MGRGGGGWGVWDRWREISKPFESACSDGGGEGEGGEGEGEGEGGRGDEEEEEEEEEEEGEGEDNWESSSEKSNCGGKFLK